MKFFVILHEGDMAPPAFLTHSKFSRGGGVAGDPLLIRTGSLFSIKFLFYR